MPSYYKIHQDLKRQKGKAAEHRCACGAPARDWAYQPNPANEKTDGYTGRSYSEDLEDYAPMCRPCHLNLDSALRAGKTGGTTPEAKARHRAGAAKGNQAHARRMESDPGYAARTTEILRQNGRTAGAKGRNRRRKCADCSMVSHPVGIGRHQAATGHTNYTEETPL